MADDRSRPESIPALTGVRGVAALWVVLYHLTLGTNIHVLRQGYLGVDLFFVLSGFILSHVYGSTPGLWKPAGYLQFLKIRLARVYPLHLVTLCGLGAAVLLLPAFADHYPIPDQRWGTGAFVASLLLVQNWAYFLPTCWNTPSWSLSAEWLAYLLFPLFVAVTAWPRGRVFPTALAAIALATLVTILRLKGVAGTNAAGTLGLLRVITEFSAGCLLYRARANGLMRMPPVADVIGLGVLLASAAEVLNIFAALPATALIILRASHPRSPTTRCLSLPLFVWLGEVSFSLYMVHWIVIQICNYIAGEMHGPPAFVKAASGAAALLGSFTVGIAAHRWIELPARAWGRRLGTRSMARKSEPYLPLTPAIAPLVTRRRDNVP
jgi:peptidoglycan/LPS O-acetylase OafA/YrhL